MIKNIAFTFTKFQYFTWLPVVYYSIEMTQTERLYHIVNTDSNWQNLIFTKHNNSTQISTYYPIMGRCTMYFVHFPKLCFNIWKQSSRSHRTHHSKTPYLSLLMKPHEILQMTILSRFFFFFFFALRTINHCLTSKLTTMDLG